MLNGIEFKAKRKRGPVDMAQIAASNKKGPTNLQGPQLAQITPLRAYIVGPLAMDA